MSSFFHRYHNLVKTRPLATNIISTGILFGTGDLLAQALERRQAQNKLQLQPATAFDGARTLRATTYGALGFAPLATKWFGFVAKTHLGGASKFLNTIGRVALDQGIFAPFVGIPLYFSAMTVLETGTGGDVALRVKEKVTDNWYDTVLANWMVWPAVQLVNFAVVPVDLRLLVVNVVSIGWNCFLLLENGKKVDH